MRAGVAGVLLLAGALAWAQRPKTPVFRSRTSLVQITVLVTGSHGPVTGLKASNFIVMENGHQQPIRIFAVNDNREPARTVAMAAAPAASTAKPYSNQDTRQPGMVVVLFDAADSPGGMHRFNGQPVFQSTRSFAWAKGRALDFLRKLPGNEDVELYGFDRSLHLLAAFSQDRQRLVAALKAYTPNVAEYANVGGGPATGVPGDFDQKNAEAVAAIGAVQRRSRAENTVEALRQIAAQAAGISGRISLIWLLARPPLSGALVEAALGHNNRIAVYPVDVRGLLPREPVEPVSGNDNPDDGLSIAAAVARLEVQPIGQGAMLDIAQATGGRAFINTNDIGGAIATAAADSDYSYTLGFYLPAREVDNRFHKLKVKLRGVKHAQLRYPHGFWATAASNPTRSGAAALLAALHSPVEAALIPLTAHLRPISKSGDLQLNATLDVHALDFTHVPGFHDASVLLITVEQDVRGNFVGGSQKRLNLHCPDAQFAALERAGLRLTQPIAHLPGATTLRLMAEDISTGATGSLIIAMPKSP